MTARELVLLSPYRLPTQHPLTLADEDMACWLNGWTALWHPVALWQASGPPRVDSSYDHETPRPGHVYAVPEAPTSLLPDDWLQRASAAGAFVFRASADREVTIANLKAALDQHTTKPLAQLPAETVAHCFGLGLGYLLLKTLSEAMEHENLLETNVFWNHLQCAVAAAAGFPMPHDAAAAEGQGKVEGEAEGEQPASATELPVWQQHFKAAALRLLAARESLYPVAIHLLDLVLLEDQDLQNPWPITVTHGQPTNVIASAAMLEKLHQENPAAIASLADAVKSEQAEVCGGGYLEREEALLPIESQLWNLSKGLAVTRQLLGAPVQVFARRRFGAYPHLPTWLHQHGITRAVLLPGDQPGLPVYSSPTMSWSGQDGQQIDCFVRKPLAAGSIEAFFNLGHHLFKTTREDHTATLAFLHAKRQAQPWYGDLLALSQLAPVAGQWTTFTRYFGTATVGDYAGTLGADDFHFDHLTERVPAGLPPGEAGRAYSASLPVSGFAQHVRLRRRLDTCWTLAAMQRGLIGKNDLEHLDKSLQELEDKLEKTAADMVPAQVLTRLTDLEQQVSTRLADRLVARAPQQQPGYLLLNPCSFIRRLALELPGRGLPIPVVDPVKAVQVDGDKLLVVAEVPGLGFAWLPQSAPAGKSAAPARVRLADERCVRNEFFEAEIDPATGGLRAIRDHKTMLNRISQRLIFRPGSTMKASQVKTTSTGPALGEIVSEGVLLGAQDQVLAKFRQRFRAWFGRPILDIRIELYPEQPPAGNPWHAYFGAQFAWRDERALLLRGLGGTGYVTTHVRPQTPDFLEIRLSRQRTSIFPGGLPFHQREGGRMLDVILVPAGEPAQVFDLAIGLDREQPMQTAFGLVTPATVVPTTKGPPHVGAKGWLFHLDAPNLLMTSMRPGGQEYPSDGSAPREIMDAVTARLLEISGQQTPAELRCIRNPASVAVLDARGQMVMPGTQNGDAAGFQVGPGGFLQLQVQFSR